MELQTKQCQNCKQNFTIEPEDFEFYQKINVPAPTFCPDCRMQRRFMWRNERSLYKNKCAVTGKNIISGFSPEGGMVVYDRELWWSDSWDALSFGADYDFSKPFFEQFNDLIRKTPMPAVFNARTVNSDYSQYTGNFKNGYLVSASWIGEDISYSSRIHESKNLIDCFMAANSEFCYEGIALTKSYNTFFSQNAENCFDSYFLFNCKGCSNCFGCTNLRGQNYCIFNKPYSKEEYFKILGDFDLGSYGKIENFKKKFSEIKLGVLRKYANILSSSQVTGDNISNTANCKSCFDVSNDARDGKFLQNALHIKDSYDGYGVGGNAELLYELFDSGVQGSRLFFSATVYGGMNVRYSFNCHGSSNIFGCVGLRNKEYCILNKQYTKEEYEKLVPQIIEHMNTMPFIAKRKKVNGKSESAEEFEEIIYRYGEFFPSQLSPFAYNETVAQEYFSLTKEQAFEQGYVWKDSGEHNVQITLSNFQLPDHIKDVTDDILKQVIGCEHEGKCNEQCTTAFKIIPSELEFYRKMNLPLPRLCPNCRHYQRIKQRNPLKLWKRKCQCNGKESVNSNQGTGKYQNTSQHSHGDEPCLNEFETTYAPDRPETVYCESCYQQEVV